MNLKGMKVGYQPFNQMATRTSIIESTKTYKNEEGIKYTLAIMKNGDEICIEECNFK